ncbi:MAG: hypothetical protein ACYC8S_00115 [Minisyncoccota bacterium]
MIVNAEVKKVGNENPVTLIKRFSRRVQQTGLIRKVKDGRYFERQESKYKTRARALKALERRKAYERLKKLGKLPPAKKRGFR